MNSSTVKIYNEPVGEHVGPDGAGFLTYTVKHLVNQRYINFIKLSCINTETTIMLIVPPSVLCILLLLVMSRAAPPILHVACLVIAEKQFKTQQVLQQ